ncbi:universal stress protein [Mesosutterella sp. OilRF-GAM-744-9]|uniref:Universal stress protein n=1 Tax=Mesosutterella porci TaxID=2915351 RepID=A0ABS9MPV5_9BURK|nr:universal stress protein [Mesosutterella sp. oilRF-744-WT-GAM-9]MCG5030300.1 universal stress protein [Mesosutterella sp. oilRF-744-WT-GAM-9]MCI6531114.1 universal stress protein [Mesosutterella sp.]
MFKKILATTDGSELAQKGIDQAMKLAKQLGAQLLVVSAEEPYSYANVTAYRPESFESYNDRVKAETAERLEEARRLAERNGMTAEFLPVKGNTPAEAILEACRSRGCDLIVMATHGRSGLSAVLLGSVTAKVIKESPVPVLVVR